MPRTVVIWQEATRAHVYNVMAELGKEYFQTDDPWTADKALRHTAKLDDIFQRAQVKAKLPPELLRSHISGAVELAKMTPVIKKALVRIVTTESLQALEKAEPMPPFRRRVNKPGKRINLKDLKPLAVIKTPEEMAKEFGETGKVAIEVKPYEPGYHLKPIKKGVLGQLSKVQEELDEAVDAEKQGVKLMVLQELSDLVGAVAAYLDVQAPGTTIQDLVAMATVTQRAFKSGRRS